MVSGRNVLRIKIRSVCVCFNLELIILNVDTEGRTEMFYLTIHSIHFIYGYMASDRDT